MNSLLKRLPVFFITGLLFINVFIYFVDFSEAGRGELRIAFLDVGQGDSIFIEAPNGNQMLIDGGATRQVLNSLSEVMPSFDKSIDVVVMTHTDRDHIGGLVDIFNSYEVESVLSPGFVADSSDYKSFEKEVEENRILQEIADKGEVITLDDVAGVYLFVLSPEGTLEERQKAESNDASIIMKLVYGNTSIMLTGDASSAIESRLVFENGKIVGGLLDADILKVGHHGSKYSTSNLFLEAVTPEVAVISAGKENPYGHPTPEVLGRLKSAGTKTFGTYDMGTIIFESDGVKLRLLNSR